MLNKSIAYRLSIYISLAVVSVFIAFILISYLFNRNILKQNIENKAIGMSSEIRMEVEKLLISTEEITSNVANQILYYGEHDNTELLLSSVMQRYSFLDAFHINIDSTLLNQNLHNYVIYRVGDSMIFEERNEIRYHCEMEGQAVEDLLQNRKAGWTRPFRCPEENQVTISYYCPVYLNIDDKVKYAGDVISELSLLDLNDTINSFKVGERGFAFIVSQDGEYITHPNKEWILNRNLYTLPQKIYNREEINVNDILSNQKSGSAIAYSEMLGFEKSWVYYSPISENGWYLIFIVPYNELFQPLYQSLLRMLFFSIIGILIIYLIITYITSKLIEPLSSVTSQLKKFSNLSGNFSVNSQNEVKVVSESLEYLKLWYEDYKIRLQQEKKKSSRQLQDMMQASEIQNSLIKTDFPAFPERNDLDLYAIYKPLNVISGDLFDYFFIDDENLVITMGDVSGKGIPAAIFMGIAQTIIKINTNVKKAKNIVNKVNKELYTNNQHQFFLTLFLGVLNVKTGTFNFCNAAHTSTLILRADRKIDMLNYSHGLPLGLYPNKEYSDGKVIIEKGDSIILYTDGVTETQDNDNNQLGIDGLKKIVGQLKNLTAEDMVKSLEKDIVEFRNGKKQTDDLSLLIMKYNP